MRDSSRRFATSASTRPDAESVCPVQLDAAMGQLVAECEALIGDRECLVPLALLRQGVEAFGEEETAQKNAGLLQFPRYALSRLMARLWVLLDVQRQAASSASGAVKS